MIEKCKKNKIRYNTFKIKSLPMTLVASVCNQVIGRQRKEDLKFEVILSYMVVLKPIQTTLSHKTKRSFCKSSSLGLEQYVIEISEHRIPGEGKYNKKLQLYSAFQINKNYFVSWFLSRHGFSVQPQLFQTSVTHAGLKLEIFLFLCVVF